MNHLGSIRGTMLREQSFMFWTAASTPAQGRGRVIDMPHDSAAYAAQLYAELHKADGEGWDWIAVRKPPETAGVGRHSDRLKRAQPA